MRNYHKEGHAYNLSSIPLIKCYENIEELPVLLNGINSMTGSKRRELQHNSVEIIRKQYDWFETAHKLINS